MLGVTVDLQQRHERPGQKRCINGEVVLLIHQQRPNGDKQHDPAQPGYMLWHCNQILLDQLLPTSAPAHALDS